MALPKGYSEWTWTLKLGNSQVQLQLYSCIKCAALVWPDAAGVQTHDRFHADLKPVQPTTIGGTP